MLKYFCCLFIIVCTSNIQLYSLTDDNQELALLNAAFDGDTEEVIKLIELGNDPNLQAQGGFTPLMYASGNGHFDAVKTLVENEADINIRPDNGKTALFGAVLGNHYDVTLYLLQNGAETEVRDNMGVTPLLYSVAYNNFEITELLLMFGTDPNQTDFEGASALHAAALYSDLLIAWILLDYGAAIDKKDIYGFTPLIMAAQMGRTDMFNYLVENGADISVKTNDGLSALAISIGNNRSEMAGKLIELGADPFEKISGTDNLMNLALWKRDRELIDLLDIYDVKPNIIPSFSTLKISANILFNTGDFLNRLEASIEDDKYNITLNLGWSTRPVRRSILVEYSDGWYDQLWEQRHLFHGGIGMKFPIRLSTSLNEEGFQAGISIMYSRGRYWGTYRSPEPGFHLVPTVKYYKESNWWFYTIGYEYINLNITGKHSHWLTGGVGIKIPIKNEPLIYRTTYW